MKAAGIICEYNPFHNGHTYHIEQSKKITGCDVLICVMSGNFVQRGEPAIIDKWIRTKTALSKGIDIVIELPFPFVMQSASYFAKGAIDCLALAKVTDIVFGSETNDLASLIKLAHIHPADYRDFMEGGLSAAKAYEILYGKINPNDILGINYIQALEPYGMTPHTIKRNNDYHSNEITSQFASASALRHALYNKKDIDAYTPIDFHSLTLHSLEEYYPYLQGLLFTHSTDDLHKIFLMDEGIEHQLIEKAKQYDQFADFLQAVTSKRYTASRIRRALIHLLHQTTKADMDQLPTLQHLRILGFSATGRAYLKELKENSDVKIASRINQIPLPYRKMEMKTAHMYGLMHNQKETLKQELQPPIRL